MKNKYLLPIIFILLISATKISLHRNLWNFKDHKRIEYDLSMNAFNEVNYLNQKNGVKVKADLVVKIKDSIYANILLENKKIIEKISDSITSYKEIKLNNDILFENYTYKGKVEGKVSEEATAIKDFIFPIISRGINKGDSITESFKVPFSLGNSVLNIKTKNVIYKENTQNGISSYSSKISSLKYKVENTDIPNMNVFLDGKTYFQFDENKGIFLNQTINLNIYIKSELDNKSFKDILTFRISQDIKFKKLE